MKAFSICLIIFFALSCNKKSTPIPTWTSSKVPGKFLSGDTGKTWRAVLIEVREDYWDTDSLRWLPYDNYRYQFTNAKIHFQSDSNYQSSDTIADALMIPPEGIFIPNSPTEFDSLCIKAPTSPNTPLPKIFVEKLLYSGPPPGEFIDLDIDYLEPSLDLKRKVIVRIVPLN